MFDYILWFYYGPAVFPCLYKDVALLDFNSYLIGLIVFHSAELLVEIVQFASLGYNAYLFERSNFQDVVSVMSGFFHIVYSYFDDPFSNPAKWCIIICILSNIMAFSEVIRVFDCFRPIVAMLRRALADMKYFFITILFCCFMLSMCLAVLQFCNNDTYWNRYEGMTQFERINYSQPNLEYQLMPI